MRHNNVEPCFVASLTCAQSKRVNYARYIVSSCQIHGNCALHGSTPLYKQKQITLLSSYLSIAPSKFTQLITRKFIFSVQDIIFISYSQWILQIYLHRHERWYQVRVVEAFTIKLVRIIISSMQIV